MPRYLGQHFLANKNKLRKIVDALELKSGDTVIEIGPGHGELTKEIRNEKLEIKIIAIEKDEKLIDLLKEKFGDDKNIKIISGDALRVLPKLTDNKQLTTNNYKLAGNIPYYITGYLFRILGELKNKPSLIVLTIQREVAERVAAKPPEMNLLAASVQFWAEPKIAGYISKKYFRPAPKVDSAIIKLLPRINTDKKQIDADKYYKFIKILFKQPRKTILNNLTAGTKNKEEIIKKLQKLNINPTDRPQNLTIEQIKKLSKLF
jgi:16S rRNA (adenine1518-N6/adenine1519-N6)-dimethyltransferase